MAVPKISGKIIWLYYQDGTKLADDGVTEVPNWLAFACSTTDGFSGSTESVTAATKCDGDWVDNLPTDSSWEFQNSGYAVKDADLSAEQASHEKAFELWSTQTEGMFKLANADDSYLRIGQGFISAYSETADTSDYLQFELTITGKGSIGNVVPV